MDTTHMQWVQEAVRIAQQATCERAQCGAVIVQGDVIIGTGYNSPPAHDPHQRRCSNEKTSYHSKVTDKTCCMHAEQRAIMDALARNPDKLPGSILYFIRLAPNGDMAFSGAPYCTICSKMALDVGISTFVLVHKDGPRAYDTRAYNDASYAYMTDRTL